MWLDYQLKENEVYMNSIDFLYCVKCFLSMRRLEIWSRQKGYYLNFENDNEMFLHLDFIKETGCVQIESFIENSMTKMEV